MIVLTDLFKIRMQAVLIALFVVCALSFGSAALADGEDVTDNEVCLECHSDTERTEPAESDKARLHNPDGSMTIEEHDMWSCVDCHVEIEELPHPDGLVVEEVDCLACHEETPEG